MKNLKIFFLHLLFAVVTSTTCTNPIGLKLGFAIPSSPILYSGSHCKSLSGNNICCQKDTITQFQSSIDKIKHSLIELAKERDLFIYTNIKPLREQYIILNKKFNSTALAAIQKLNRTTLISSSVYMPLSTSLETRLYI